jgi:hypothetical protein
MADPFKEAMGRAMESENPGKKAEPGGLEDSAGGGRGEVHSMHHFNHGGKHSVMKHHSGGVEHSEHGAGEQEETCPLCGGTGEVGEK